MASSPLVVPDRVRMASAIFWSVSIAGRPSAAPPSITPPDSASRASCSSSRKVTFLTVKPSLSASGPMLASLSAIAV